MPRCWFKKGRPSTAGLLVVGAAVSAHGFCFGFPRLQLTLCVPRSPECLCLLEYLLQGARGEEPGAVGVGAGHYRAGRGVVGLTHSCCCGFSFNCYLICKGREGCCFQDMPEW